MTARVVRSLPSLLLPLAVATSSALGAQQTQQPAPASATSTRLLPQDSAVTVGTLPNGLRYYIRVNHRPEKRAELRLVVNAGSILEDTTQRGLAHFIEHMAFNGTTHFAKNDMVNYIESIGVRFGADLNAYTSFDETVYMLQVPTDSARQLATGFQILEDWAHGVTFSESEAEKERGVVLEEWRRGRGAAMRIQNKQFPILFAGSLYATRLPIGDPARIQQFDSTQARRFYADWYRPDLMAVVAVGDFDKARIEALIKERFGNIAAPATEKPRTYAAVPPNDTTLVAIATDKEATASQVIVYYKLPPRVRGTVGEFREDLMASLYSDMFNSRLSEITQKPDAPFIAAFGGRSTLVRNVDDYELVARVQEGGIARGLGALLTEAERVDKYGFTQTELDRAKRDMLRGYEQAYAEREKTNSSAYTDEYVSNFLEREPMPGIAAEYELAKQIVPEVPLAEVNGLARAWISDRNRIVTVSAPDKEGVTVPTRAELLAVFDSVRGKQIAAYTETVSDAPLVARAPTAGRVIATKRRPAVGVQEWTLSNGARVILKPTDFKADEVLFRAVSSGGNSLASNEDLLQAQAAAAAAQIGGAGSFSRIDLQKKLAGKAAGAAPFINTLEQGFVGSASPKDIETMLQLVYLYFTAPRADSSAFLAFKSNSKAAIANRGANPASAFSDTLALTLTQHNPRVRIPPTPAMYDSMDLRRALAFYKARFADASGFTFYFVGSFDPDSLRPLVERYLGGLPSLHRKETWRDVGIHAPTGVVERSVLKGTEPKSQTALVFTGPFVYNRANQYAIGALSDVLGIRLREVLREQLGGTYTVGVDGAGAKYPRPEYTFSVSFGSAPERVDQLVKAVFTQIDSLKRYGPSKELVEKVRETERRERETALKQNGFWLGQLVTADRNGLDIDDVPNFEKMLATLSPTLIQSAAKQYLRTNNYVRVSLYPESYRVTGK